MLSLVLILAIALVLCSQVLLLPQEFYNNNNNNNRIGKYVRFRVDESKLEVKSYQDSKSNNQRNEVRRGANNEHSEIKDHEKEEEEKEEEEEGKEEDNEQFESRRIKDPNGILPEFSTPVGNVTATLGRDARLICTVENLGPYQVAWLKVETNTVLSIGTNIITSNYRMFLIPDEEERKWVLHIKDVQVSDRGIYQCQVNTVPVRTISGYLEVLVPPTIIESQTSQAVDVIEHSNATIQCKADGYPKVNISWRRDDGSPIKLNGIGNYSGKLIESLQPVIGIEMPNLSSGVWDFLPYFQFAYIINQAALNEISSETLSLQQVDRSMAGVYVCIASNGITTQANKRIPLYVRFSPKTSVQNHSQLASLGDQFEVECTIESYPRANNLWLKKLERAIKVPQKSSRALILTNSNKFSNSLAIGFDNFLQPNDNLNFVRQKRQHTHQNSSIGQNLLENQLKPSNFKLINQTILENTNAYLTKMSGAFFGREILPINKSTTTTVRQTIINSYTYKLKLAIAKVTQEDYGEYTCVSINPLGNSTTNFILLKVQNEGSKLSKTTLNDPRQKHQVESNETNSNLQDVKILPKSANLLKPKTSIRRTGNQVYDENYLQAIKSRQGNANRSVKLKHRGNNKNSATNSLSTLDYRLSLSLTSLLFLQRFESIQELINL